MAVQTRRDNRFQLPPTGGGYETMPSPGGTIGGGFETIINPLDGLTVDGGGGFSSMPPSQDRMPMSASIGAAAFPPQGRVVPPTVGGFAGGSGGGAPGFAGGSPPMAGGAPRAPQPFNPLDGLTPDMGRTTDLQTPGQRVVPGQSRGMGAVTKKRGRMY